MPSLRKDSLTPFQLHRKKWGSCKECDLCHTRKSVVLARGKIPADIIMIGEAPGASEDVLGSPFTGPAGALLDRIIAKAIPDTYRVAFTNLVACIPLGEDGDKTAEPPKESIQKCRKRLLEFVILCQPRLVVHVGKLAEKHANIEGIESVLIAHPASILRASVVSRDLMIQNCIITLRDVVEEMEENQ